MIRHSVVWLVLVVGMALAKFPAGELAKPVLWLVVLGIAVSVLCGAKTLLHSLLPAAIGLAVIATGWPWVAASIRRWFADPAVQRWVILGVVLVVLAGVVALFAKASALRHRYRYHGQMPSIRVRGAVVDPEVPADERDGGPGPHGPDGDDLHLFTKDLAPIDRGVRYK